MTIRFKLLVFGISIVLIPILIIGIFVYNKAHDRLLDISEKNIASVSEMIAELIQTGLSREVDFMREISVGITSTVFAEELSKNNDSPDMTLVETMNQKLDNFVMEMGENYEAVFIANKKGIVVSSANAKKNMGVNVGDREYFKKAMKGGISLGQVVTSKSSSNYIVLFALPFKDKNNEIVGIISAAVKLSAWSEITKKFKYGNSGFIVMVDEKTRTIAHPNTSIVMKVTQTEVKGMEGVAEKILKKESGIVKYKFKGIDKIAATKYLNLSGWSIIAVQDKDDFMVSVYEIRNTIFYVGLIFIILSMIVVYFFSKGISASLKKAMETAENVSKGDFTGRLNLKRSDEIGHLSGALDNMADNLEAKGLLARAIASGDLRKNVKMASDKDMLGEALKNMVDHLNSVIYKIRTASEEVMSGAQQVSDSSQSLSQGAAEQAASMEEITSSMTQIASQINQNAENATQCESLAKDSQHYAEMGNNEMHNMITAMTEISNSSKEIEKIIKSIDEIAFQTNLLALNAAVEAARAGRHGKGFAVVAEEVRNLAARSAKAAKETAELIEASVGKVDTGMKIAEKTAEALTKIVESGTKFSSLTAEIATACNHQAQGVSQINQGLNQMDQVTQTNTANSEETASASEELSGQADELQRLISNFKLKDVNVTLQYKNINQKNKKIVNSAGRISYTN